MNSWIFKPHFFFFIKPHFFMSVRRVCWGLGVQSATSLNVKALQIKAISFCVAVSIQHFPADSPMRSGHSCQGGDCSAAGLCSLGHKCTVSTGQSEILKITPRMLFLPLSVSRALQVPAVEHTWSPGSLELSQSILHSMVEGASALSLRAARPPPSLLGPLPLWAVCAGVSPPH